jgi:hypothetical protein
VSFSADFAFHRDDRAIGGSPDDSFWDQMRKEAGDELEQRTATYPKLVAKGRLSRTDCDRELRVWRAIAEDWRAAPRSAGFPIATWTEMAHALRREINLRRTLYPRWILAGRVDSDEAERKLQLLEVWHDVLWHSNLPEARAARQAVARILADRGDLLAA